MLPILEFACLLRCSNLIGYLDLKKKIEPFCGFYFP